MQTEYATYPESQLQIRNWFKETDSFVVACVRCGNAVEISKDFVLEPLECPKCDGRIENKRPQNQLKQTKVTLVPAHINLPDGTQVFVYLPMLLEGPYELSS